MRDEPERAGPIGPTFRHNHRPRFWRLIRCFMSALRPLAASLRCGDSVLDDFGGSESLTLVPVFTPKAAAFEVGLRELLRSISVTSNGSLVCADGRGEHVLFIFLALKSPSYIRHN